MDRGNINIPKIFLLTPLREGRLSGETPGQNVVIYFYSRPCGRGDDFGMSQGERIDGKFLLTPLREGRPW